MIRGLVSNYNTDKLKEFGLFFLETRKRNNMIQTFKILKGSNSEVWLKKNCDTSVRNTRQSEDPTRLTKQRTIQILGANFQSEGDRGLEPNP